jgi:hypothetical protein
LLIAKGKTVCSKCLNEGRCDAESVSCHTVSPPFHNARRDVIVNYRNTVRHTTR